MSFVRNAEILVGRIDEEYFWLENDSNGSVPSFVCYKALVQELS
jgi:hypothetical protein